MTAGMFDIQIGKQEPAQLARCALPSPAQIVPIRSVRTVEAAAIRAGRA